MVRISLRSAANADGNGVKVAVGPDTAYTTMSDLEAYARSRFGIFRHGCPSQSMGTQSRASTWGVGTDRPTMPDSRLRRRPRPGFETET